VDFPAAEMPVITITEPGRNAAPFPLVVDVFTGLTLRQGSVRTELDSDARPRRRPSRLARQSGHHGAQMASANTDASALETADELARASQQVIGSNLVAVTLHGSLVSGDFVANKSDIDLLVVVQRPLADEQKRILESAVTSLARDLSLDYRVVTANVALNPPRLPMLDFYVGVHPGVPDGVEVEHAPIREPDLLFEFAICREEGRSLVGRAPTRLIGPVPNDWLLDVGDAYLKRWQEIDYDDRDAELMVLTACRLWYRCVEGHHCTKSEAAIWATRQDPDLLAPGSALERRTTDARHPIPEADVKRLLAKVREVISTRPPG
jgi:streptomycin 3"-adenylyltransferase